MISNVALLRFLMDDWQILLLIDAMRFGAYAAQWGADNTQTDLADLQDGGGSCSSAIKKGQTYYLAISPRNIFVIGRKVVHVISVFLRFDLVSL